MYKTQVKEPTLITPQMIRETVEVLQMRKLFVNTALIADYLKRHYPVGNTILERELISMLKCAVKVGLIVKCGQDEFCIPTLLQDANAVETALSAFWELYYGSNRMPIVPNNRQLSGMVSFEDNEWFFNKD